MAAPLLQLSVIFEIKITEILPTSLTTYWTVSVYRYQWVEMHDKTIREAKKIQNKLRTSQFIQTKSTNIFLICWSISEWHQLCTVTVHLCMPLSSTELWCMYYSTVVSVFPRTVSPWWSFCWHREICNRNCWDHHISADRVDKMLPRISADNKRLAMPV